MRILYLFICITAILSYGFSDSDPDTLLIEDPREAFTVAVIAGDHSGDSEQNEYLIEKLREHIIRSVGSLEFHEYSRDELQRYAVILKSMRLEENERQLSRLFSQRDEAYLYGEREKSVNFEEEIAKLEVQRDRILHSDNVEYAITRKKTIAVDDTERSLALLPDKEYMMQEGIDYAVYYETFPVEDLFGIQLRTVSFDGITELSGKRIGSIEEIFTQIDSIVHDITDSIRGYDTVRIVLRSHPDDAVITVDDEAVGTGLFAADLKPGAYTVRVSRIGYETHTEEIILSDTALTKNINLPRLPALRYILYSLPAGASVYADSKPIGTTPLFYDTHNPYQLLQFNFEGYQSSSYLLGEDSPEHIIMELRPDYKDREDLFENRKWNFYRSFGSFLLSVPVTLFLNNYRNTFAAEYQNFESEYQLTTISMYGSIYINVVLFAQTVISLREYIQMGNETIRGEFSGDR